MLDLPFPDLKSIRGLGYEPGLYDHNVKVFGAVADFDAASLPSAIEPLDAEFPIYNQSTASACVGFSFKEAAQILLWQQLGKRVSISPGFLWYLARAVRGWQNRNTGCVISDLIACAAKYGTPSETVDPWDPERFANRPSDEAFDQAADHGLGDYEATESVLAAKIALHLKHPVIMGTALTESFDDVKRQGGNFPVPSGRTIGGHAMTYVAYDDDRAFPEWRTVGGFKTRNHWTQAFGADGYVWIPYAHHASGAVMEAYALKLLKD